MGMSDGSGLGAGVGSAVVVVVVVVSAAVVSSPHIRTPKSGTYVGAISLPTPQQSILA